MNRYIHRFASEDLAEAAQFYKREAGIGLARRFLNEFERVAKLLEQHPGLGTPTADGRKVHPLTDFHTLLSIGTKSSRFVFWLFGTRVVTQSTVTAADSESPRVFASNATLNSNPMLRKSPSP